MSTYNIVAQGGVRFHVSRDGQFLGSMEHGEVTESGRYIGDDDEIIEAAIEQFAGDGDGREMDKWIVS